MGAVISNDSSHSSGLDVPLSPVPALTFSLISDVSHPDTIKSSYDVGTLYNLYAKFNSPPDLNADFSGVSISCPNATIGAITSVDGNNKYKFKLTPNNSGTNQISISNAKDVNNFIYSLFTSGNLTFNLPPPLTDWSRLLSTGNRTSTITATYINLNASGGDGIRQGLVDGNTGSSNSSGWWNSPLVVGQAIDRSNVVKTKKQVNNILKVGGIDQNNIISTSRRRK